MPLILPRRFNGSSSIISYPANVTQGVGRQTMYAKVRIAGAGENVAGGYIMSAYDAGNRNGLLLRYRSDTGIGVLADSSGTANQPTKISAFAVTAGAIRKIFVYWDGGITANGIDIYEAENATLTVKSTVATSIDGTGSPIAAGAAVINCIGNNPTNTRTLLGDAFELARWSRFLFDWERQRVELYGAWTVPNGLIFDWHDGFDWGPFHLQAPTMLDVGIGATSVFSNFGDDEDDFDTNAFTPTGAAAVPRTFAAVMG